MSNSIPGARPVGAIRAHALPFLLGVAAGAYVLYGAGQDQLVGLSGLAPAAVFLATLAGENLFVFGILLNGILYALTAAAIQRLWATRRWLSVLTAILAGLWAIFPLLGSWEAHQLQPNTEVVMTPGMRIIATTPNGPLTITAGQGTRRSYSGEGWSKSISLIARSQRWYGSLGLYDPADSFSPYGRLLAEEGQLHFSTVARAMGWIHERNLEAVSADDRPIYTGDGLVLCYSNRPVPGSGVATRSVQIWQFYVGGSRPHDLPGASDGAIHVEGGAIAATSTTVAAPAQ